MVLKVPKNGNGALPGGSNRLVKEEGPIVSQPRLAWCVRTAALIVLFLGAPWHRTTAGVPLTIDGWDWAVTSPSPPPPAAFPTSLFQGMVPTDPGAYSEVYLLVWVVGSNNWSSVKFTQIGGPADIGGQTQTSFVIDNSPGPVPCPGGPYFGNVFCLPILNPGPPRGIYEFTAEVVPAEPSAGYTVFTTGLFFVGGTPTGPPNMGSGPVLFTIYGIGDGSPWSILISAPPSGLGPPGIIVPPGTPPGPTIPTAMIPMPPNPPGTGPAVFAQQFVNAINASYGPSGFVAAIGPAPGQFTVAGPPPWDLWVGPDLFGRPTCLVRNNSCQFNPEIQRTEFAEVPTVSRWAIMAIMLAQLALIPCFLHRRPH